MLNMLMNSMMINATMNTVVSLLELVACMYTAMIDVPPGAAATTFGS